MYLSDLLYISFSNSYGYVNTSVSIVIKNLLKHHTEISIFSQSMNKSSILALYVIINQLNSGILLCIKNLFTIWVSNTIVQYVILKQQQIGILTHIFGLDIKAMNIFANLVIGNTKPTMVSNFILRLSMKA